MDFYLDIQSLFAMSTEHLQDEKKFSFSDMKSTVMNFVNQHLFRFEKKSIEKQMQEPVNNYFKTPEQMEADFSVENSGQLVFFREQTAEEIYLLTINQSAIKDGHINTQDLLNYNAGYMEENY